MGYTISYRSNSSRPVSAKQDIFRGQNYQRSELRQAFGTRAEYTTSLAPRNLPSRSIVSPISEETSLSVGAPGSAWTELTWSFPLILSMSRSVLPMSLSPHKIGCTNVPNFLFSFGRKFSWM